MKLGGQLVGYCVKKRNGEEIITWLEKPIKNTVTKHCLNNLLQYNGDNATGTGESLFIYAENSTTRTGVFNYCAYGSGSGATSTNDDELKQIKSEYTSAKRQEGGYYNCSMIDTSNKLFKFRVTHTFGAASENVTIKEIGWFHKVEPNGVYNMSARVLLDNPIELSAGDTFECTYQFEVSPDFDPVVIPNFWNGYAVRKCANISSTSSLNTWRAGNYFPIPGVWFNSNAADGKKVQSNYFWRSSTSGITESDRGVTAKATPFSLPTQIKAYYNYSAYSFGANLTPILSNFNLPTNFGTGISSPGNNAYNGMQTITILDYVQDSFYRDYVIKVNNLWAADSDVYGMAYNGEIYQFGTYAADTFTPAPIHKDVGKEWTFTFRQSWGTDLLSPSA